MGSSCDNSKLWACPHCELYNASGGVDQYAKAGFTTSSQVSYASGTSGHSRAKTTANTYELFETRVQEVGDPYLIIGILEGVCALVAGSYGAE